jgi:hypothetical protein
MAYNRSNELCYGERREKSMSQLTHLVIHAPCTGNILYCINTPVVKAFGFKFVAECSFLFLTFFLVWRCLRRMIVYHGNHIFQVPITVVKNQSFNESTDTDKSLTGCVKPGIVSKGALLKYLMKVSWLMVADISMTFKVLCLLKSSFSSRRRKSPSRERSWT